MAHLVNDEKSGESTANSSTPLSLRATFVVLRNGQWQVVLQPQTLAIRVQPMGQKSLVVSEGLTPHRMTQLQQNGQKQVTWQWDQGAWQLQATLKGSDLALSIVAKSAGTLAVLQQPASAYGKGLILPLAEGHYIPKDHALWQDFLLQKKPEYNTTQDLTLPLWGMDHGSYSLHWIFTNPFNNQLAFQRKQSGLNLSLAHQFTTLAPTEPLTFILHLGEADPLAGARRYRRWLIEQGRFEPLKEKLAKVPEGKKLLGASHLYLWGNGPLTPEDVYSWPAFLQCLQADSAFSTAIRQRLATEAKQLLVSIIPPLTDYQQQMLISAFNQALTNWARESWQKTEINLDQLVTRYGELTQQLAQHFKSALTTDASRWGGGLSIKTLEQLQAAGVKKAWLGVAEGWEGGLWHPAAVQHALQAGYLIAPYDSYQTALPPGKARDWVTAHLGETLYRQCGIMQANGRLKTGFQQQGYYTNPRCVRSFLQRRVQQLQPATGFNSWFLDAYATGMLFDDHRPETSMTQAQMADENEYSMAWIGDTLKVAVGSENGNAITARGLLFAHGMQTPVIGWGDADLQKNRQSPYYLGAWYPREQPTKFFKAVPIKQIYKTVHFDARYHLPLYQTVFHDSVITTHHWLFDNLKLSNVRRENELTQLLYNVPPLYHLSRATLAQRLPIIQRQAAFFRPLHQRLATQALTGFRWLSAEGDLQQTQFADGTRLIANFSTQAQQLATLTLPAHSITALQPGEAAIHYVITNDKK